MRARAVAFWNPSRAGRWPIRYTALSRLAGPPRGDRRPMMRFFCFLSLFAATLLGQTQVQVSVPNLPSFVNVDRPFPGGIGRYQQWFSAASLQAGIAEPRRITQLEFFAGTQPTSQACTIDCEILMAHGLGSGVTGLFDFNYASTPVIVKTRANVNLLAGAAGAVVMTLPFDTPFTWDRTRPVLLEVRIYGNSLGSQPFNYNFRGTTQSRGVTSRVYAGGSPGATSGTVSQGFGMMTRFTARMGVELTFGTGCPGEGGFVPVNTVPNLGWPGIVWDHQLSNAPSSRPAFWVIGDTKDAPFPVDLTAILGYPSSNCLLYTNPVNLVGVTTVGGGAGGGIVTLGVPLPPTTGYVGLSVFTQWVVFDPLAQNGALCVTPAVWTIIAPVGG